VRSDAGWKVSKDYFANVCNIVIGLEEVVKRCWFYAAILNLIAKAHE
jgi:hypothetical protein